MKKLILSILPLCLAGCVTNPFAQFYQDYTKNMNAGFLQRLMPPRNSPKFYSTSPETYDDESRRVSEAGYVMLGVSSFRGGNVSASGVKEQAKKVGADVVLSSMKFSHTEQGVTPIFDFDPGVKTTTQSGTFSGTTYGRGGMTSSSGTYSGYSTTRTQPTLKTEYIPYSRQMNDYQVTYWRKMRPGILGVLFSPIPGNVRAQLQRNTGISVSVVIENTPAYKANILRDDVIIQIGEKPVSGKEDFLEIVSSYAGQKVIFKIFRDGKPLEIPVELNKKP